MKESDLVTRAEVLDLLNISERQLQKYGASGKLTVNYVKGKRGQESRYVRKEIEELLNENNQIVTRGVTTNERTTPEPTNELTTTPFQGLTPIALSFLEQLKELLPSPSTRLSELKEKPILTLKEASALTGLSYARIREAIRNGELGAAKIGHGLMVRTEDALTYAKNLIPETPHLKQAANG
jgi:excisionase family DNA binding protein